MQPQIRRLKSAGPVPGDFGLHGRSDGLPTRTTSRSARDFSADVSQDAVILSVQDLAAAQEAVRLDRQDREDERRAAAAGLAGLAGTGSPGPGIPGQSEPPAAPPPACPQPGRPPAVRPDPSAPGPRDHTPVGPGGGGPPRASSSPPSWGTVLLTTVRLWVQRHWPARARWRVLTVLVLAAVLFGAGAITIALTRSPAGSGPSRGAQAGKSGTQAGPRRDAHPSGHPGRRGGPGGGGGLDRRPGIGATRSCRVTRRCARYWRPTGSRRRGCFRSAAAIPTRWAAT